MFCLLATILAGSAIACQEIVALIYQMVYMDLYLLMMIG
jgi:hypothetical protein